MCTRYSVGMPSTFAGLAPATRQGASVHLILLFLSAVSCFTFSQTFCVFSVSRCVIVGVRLKSLVPDLSLFPLTPDSCITVQFVLATGTPGPRGYLDQMGVEDPDVSSGPDMNTSSRCSLLVAVPPAALALCLLVCF